VRVLRWMVEAVLFKFLSERVGPKLALTGTVQYSATVEKRDLWVGLFWETSEYWATAYVVLRPTYVRMWRWSLVRISSQ
jgi:hypothetical protein